MATPFSYANTITAGTPIVAAEVQDNFDDLLDWIDTYYQQAADTTAEIAAATEPTTWTGVTYQNSWVDYGSGYQGVQYRKIGDVVHLRGLMKNGTESVAAFTLPTGFRPPADLSLIALCSSNVVCLANLDTDGVYTPDFSTGNNSYYVVNHTFSVTA